jgi:probable phosphoglycerate mutase
MDSKLVVEQMSGRWRVRHPDLQPLHAQGRELARALPKVSFGWIPRERNSYADRLANEAMDAAAQGRTWAPKEATRPVAEPKPAGLGYRAESGPPTTLLLVRHGATALSGTRFAGRADPELTAAGEAQARAVAGRLAATADVAAVVASPLHRTRQTAAPVAAALGVPVGIDDDLVEADFGHWDGRTFGEVAADWPAERAAWMVDPAVPPPGGESVDQVARRVRKSRDRLLAAHPGRTVVVVSHVTPIKLLLCAALGAPTASVFRLHLDTASLSVIEWYPTGPAVVRAVNDTGHLN